MRVGPGARQIDVHGRAVTDTGLYTHASAGLLGKPQHLAQSQPGSLANLLCGKKWLEDLPTHIFTHAAAIIGHAHDHVISGRRLLRHGRFAERDIPGRDHEAPADLHRVARVDREIEHSELELSGIDQCMSQTAI